jgi:hypothetical protein
VFAGVLSIAGGRVREIEAMKVPASRGCKSANKGRESACIALESATRGLEIVGETVRVFAGPLSIKRGHESASRDHKCANKGHEAVIHSLYFFYLLGNLALCLCATFLNLARHRMEEL